MQILLGRPNDPMPNTKIVVYILIRPTQKYLVSSSPHRSGLLGNPIPTRRPLLCQHRRCIHLRHRAARQHQPMVPSKVGRWRPRPAPSSHTSPTPCRSSASTCGAVWSGAMSNLLGDSGKPVTLETSSLTKFLRCVFQVQRIRDFQESWTCEVSESRTCDFWESWICGASESRTGDFQESWTCGASESRTCRSLESRTGGVMKFRRQ
jgi:hypothetical protein